MGRKRTEFDLSALKNNAGFMLYFNRLLELSISMFDWKNLPDSVDPRYIEMTLFSSGSAVYFNDEVLGSLCLSNIQNGNFDVYGYPIKRRAFSRYNHYQRQLNEDNSVIIWNNMIRTNSVQAIEMYAYRLYNLDRIIDVNANAQKTPILVQGTEKQKLSLINLYKEYDGNAPVIFGDSQLDVNSLKVLTTNAPFVCDKIYQLKVQYWNEALTYLGISNTNIAKKERMISDEVMRNQGGVIASRYSRLESRRQAVEKINKMFGTNIEVNYREDYREADGEVMFSGATGDGSLQNMVADLRTR